MADQYDPPKPNPLPKINQPPIEPAFLLEEDIFDKQYMHTERLQYLESPIPFGEGLREGDVLRLRDDALSHVKVREWEFKEIENGQIVLLARRGNKNILEVKADDIDWQEYRRRRELGFQLVLLTPEAYPFSEELDVALKERGVQLGRQYNAGPVIHIGTQGFRIYLKECRLKENIPNEEVLEYLIS